MGFRGDRWEARCHHGSQRRYRSRCPARVAVGCGTVVRRSAAGLCRTGRPDAVEDVAPGELASRFADPAAQEAMGYVQRTLRDELEMTRTGRLVLSRGARRCRCR